MTLRERFRCLLSHRNPFFSIFTSLMVVVAVLFVSSCNPKEEGVKDTNNHLGYDTETLIANKTPYLGDNSKVSALINVLALPPYLKLETIELQTNLQPYELTIHLSTKEATGFSNNDNIGGEELYLNSILLFSLIGNLDIVNYTINEAAEKRNEGIYSFTYTRELTEELLGEGLSTYADNSTSLKGLIGKVKLISLNPSEGLSETESKLPNFKASVENPIEQLVYDTTVERYAHEGSGFNVVAPTIHGYFEEEDKLKIFVTVFNNRYSLKDKMLMELGGSVIPVAITYIKKPDGSYTLNEYTEAMDGSYFSTSIKDFCILPVSKKEIRGLADKILKDYKNNEERSRLLSDNLILHFQSFDLKGISLKTLTDVLIPLT